MTGEALDVRQDLRIDETRGAEGASPALRGQEAVRRTRLRIGRHTGEVGEEVEDELDVDRLSFEGANALGEECDASRAQSCANAGERRSEIPRDVYRVDGIDEVGALRLDLLFHEVAVHVESSELERDLGEPRAQAPLRPA